MADVAKYIKIFTPTPDDTYVSKRITAVNSIELAIKKIAGTNVLGFATELTSALDSPTDTNDLINGVAVNALKKNSTSFVADEEQLQLLTCTLLGTLQYLEKAKGYQQISAPEFVLAIALYSGLSFQKPLDQMERLELLRMELFAVTASIVQEISLKSRNRLPVKLRTAIVAPDEKTWVAFTKNVDMSYGVVFDALRFNALLDGEELEILWWVLGGWSNLCNVQIASLNSVQKVFVSCFEIGRMLRRFPAQSHASLACKGTNHGDEYTAAEIAEELGEIIDALLSEVASNGAIKKYGKIFPVCNFLVHKIEFGGIENKRSLNEWAVRLLLEISLLNINNFPE